MHVHVHEPGNEPFALHRNDPGVGRHDDRAHGAHLRDALSIDQHDSILARHASIDRNNSAINQCDDLLATLLGGCGRAANQASEGQHEGRHEGQSESSHEYLH